MQLSLKNNTTWHRVEGPVLGVLGVLCFSLTLPATRASVPLFGGTFVGLGRAIVAAVLAALLLALRREPLPARRYWLPLATVALGVIVGFPLFSALALQTLPASHGAVINGLLPAATAVMAFVRAGERPSKFFWLACLLGVISVLFFAAVQGAGRPQLADLLLFIAVVLGALGYAEGGRLARELGGWRVICWALVLSAPVLIVPVALSFHPHGSLANPAPWLGFAYVCLFSMFLGFFVWYRALAVGGVARISQIQLIQPILTLGWAALLLGEHITLATLIASLFVIASAALSQWARTSHPAKKPAPEPAPAD